MKKIWKNGKKVVAGMVLALMAVCMVSPVVQGANSITRYGSRVRDTVNGGYYSYTKVSGHDDRGFGLKLKVGAKMGSQGEWGYKEGYGTVEVPSKRSSYIVDAWHSYKVSSEKAKEWMQN